MRLATTSENDREKRPVIKKCVCCKTRMTIDNVEALTMDDGNILCIKCYTKLAPYMEEN